MCNHLVNTAAAIPDKIHWSNFLKILQDPLVQAMLPVPHREGERAYFVDDPYDDLSLYLTCLSRLSSPILSVVRPGWLIRANEIEKQLLTTNIQPWVIPQVTTKDQNLVNAIAKISNYVPRTVVLSGHTEVVVSAPMRRIRTNIRDVNIEDLVTMPLEMIGSTLIRRFARRENLDSQIESRQDRRDRMTQERRK